MVYDYDLREYEVLAGVTFDMVSFIRCSFTFVLRCRCVSRMGRGHTDVHDIIIIITAARIRINTSQRKIQKRTFPPESESSQS